MMSLVYDINSNSILCCKSRGLLVTHSPGSPLHMNNHVHSALQSIEKEIEKKQNKERNTSSSHTHIHTTASTA